MVAIYGTYDDVLLLLLLRLLLLLLLRVSWTFRGGKGDRCVGLTTLSPLCGDWESWEPQPPGALGTYLDLIAVPLHYGLLPLCRVFTLTYLKLTMFLWYVMLQLFCVYTLWYMWCFIIIIIIIIIVVVVVVVSSNKRTVVIIKKNLKIQQIGFHVFAWLLCVSTIRPWMSLF
jgi:hypothetical protein